MHARGPIAVVLGCLFLFAIPSARSAGTYPRVEASFTINGLATDPFDYTVTDVRVQIAQPDSTLVSLPAFFDGGTTWRVRHTPAQPGIYSVNAVTVNGQPITVGNLQPSSWTVAGNSYWPGFVRVDPLNTNRFITDNGRRYFPIGNDVAWDVTSTTNVVALLSRLGAAHENWSRIWMDHWDGKNLDWPKVGSAFGTLSLTVAQKWDAIVSAAEQAGVAFQMTLHHHGQYSTTTDSNWSDNPYNTAKGGFLADPKLFFTDATAKALTKRKLRYAVARWGCSPAIMAWELFNEVQFTDAAQNSRWTNVAAWHDEMAQFIRSQDNYHHLITTSSQLDQRIWNQCDYYQHHDYPIDLISALRDAPGLPAGQPVKPIFGGECGMDNTPYLGFHGPLWAGLMGAQSGAAQQWYWDHIDADRAYNLFRSARAFVLSAGLAEQETLIKSAPHVTCPQGTSLVFGLGGGWGDAGQDTFTVVDNAPDGIGALPSFLQGDYHRSMTPNGFTFLVNYPSGGGTFSVQVVTIARSGAGLRLTVDNTLTNLVSWPPAGNDVTTNFAITVNVPAGAHTIKLWNPGLDWVNLGNLTLNPYTSMLAAYQVGTTNFAALWLWHRTNIYYTTATATVAGSVPLSGLQPGNYLGTWWDTFAGVPLSNFNFTVTGGPITLTTPAVLRSAAFFAGPPPQAAIAAASLTQTLATNSAAVTVPLVLTNGGGLPLAWSLSINGASPVSYAATSSTQTGGPVFAWKDISLIGRDLAPSFTALTGKSAGDEGVAAPIDIGFSFPFFSGAQAPGVFTQLFVSPNGFVTFSPFAGDNSLNRALPSTLAPSNSIAAFWDDLDLGASGHVYCTSDSLDGTFTIQFQNVLFKGTGNTATFQLILKTSGEILFQYKSIAVLNACTVGVQNANRDQGLQVALNQTYVQNGLAVRVTPTPWLTVSGNAGFVPRWTAEQLSLTFDPKGLAPGTYSATLLVQTADPAVPITVLPVSLRVLTPIEQWRVANFGTPDNAGDAADSADPDHDGVVNLIEYALGLDPHAVDPNPLSFSFVAGHLTLTYQRPLPAPAEVNYFAEVASELWSGLWSSGPGFVSQAVVNNGDGTETVTVTDLADAASAPAHYLRVRFSR